MTVEIPLEGGWVTSGAVRVGDTVRRPLNDSSPFVHELLRQLEAAGFEGAPRLLGIDEKGREILSFLDGEVPADLSPFYEGGTLRQAAELIREYHDATAGLAGDEEVVCHNDLGPPNTVFRDGRPAALIDFDSAAPGSRLHDLAYASLLWIDLGSDEQSLHEQGRRTRAFFEAYGLSPTPQQLVDKMLERQHHATESVKSRSRQMSAWWAARADWLEANRVQFEATLR